MGRGRQLADEAFHRYLGEPGAALDLATEGILAAKAEGDLVAESKSECVLGLIAGHLADLGSAERHLRRAIRLGDHAGDAATVAEARIHLAYMLVQEGRGRAALAELSGARPAVTESLEPWWHEVEALVLKGLGRWDEAVTEYDLALKAFDRVGDRAGRAKALINRGVALIYGGSLDAGEADLRAADVLLEDLGQPMTRIIAVQDLGWAAARRGHVPEALECYDRVLHLYAAHRPPPPSLYLDRCEVLLSVGLFAEARAAAEAAVAQADRSGHAAERSEARLRLAEAALAAGDAGTALTEARLAARDFARQRRPAWRAVARWLIIQASTAGDGRISPAEVRRVAAQLEQAGWLAYALDAWLRAGELELATGRTAAAERDLEHVARWRRSGPVWYRQLAWQAVAMLRLAHGDRIGARRAAERGMQLIEDYRDSLGATDLRALASRRLSALADLGVRTAIDDGRPALVLRWADRSRAAHLRHPPVAPPDDAELAADLARLRQVMALRVEAVESGEPHRVDLVRRQTALERSIRDRGRRVPGRGPGSAAALDIPALTATLGPATLVEYVVSGRRLHAVTWSARRRRLYELGSVDMVEKAVRFLPFTLRQLATGQSRTNSRATLALEHDGDVLDRLLLQPLGLADGPLVVVPTGILQGIPWSILPSCSARPVSVAPSAALWLSARATAAPRSGVLLVCGPGVPHGEDEIAALARLHPDARVLAGADATAENVLAAMDGVELAHLVAHGDFRADNPQFSALQLADGPLTVYDIERLRRAPRHVVLSTCDSGRSTVFAGDELLGLAPAVLSLGSQGMVASLALIPDAETRPLMLDLHGQLHAGASLAAALARAQAAARASGNPRSVAAASAFVCIGAG